MESHGTSLVLQRLAPFSCSGHPSLAVEGLLPVVWSNPWAESPSSPHCSVLPAASLGFTRVDAGFYKRMKSSLFTIKRELRGAHPFFVFCRHWVAAGETQPGRLSGKGGGGWAYLSRGSSLEVPYAEPKGRTSVRNRSMSPRLVLAASKSTYALCSGSLIRKIELGWGSTM